MMRQLWIAGWVILGLLVLPVYVQGADTKSPVGQVRRDAKGQTGISPYAEGLAKGRKAYVQNDVSGAVAAFQKAILLEPSALLGYVLLAQALITKGDLKAAAQAAEGGREAKGPEQVKAKWLFISADIAERQAGNTKTEKTATDVLNAIWDKAKTAWNAYAVFLTAHTKAEDHRAVATERGKQIAARRKRDKDYGAVKQRIKENAKKRAKKGR